MIKYHILIPAIFNQKFTITSIIQPLMIQQAIMRSYLCKSLLSSNTFWNKPKSWLLLDTTHHE